MAVPHCKRKGLPNSFPLPSAAMAFAMGGGWEGAHAHWTMQLQKSKREGGPRGATRPLAQDVGLVCMSSPLPSPPTNDWAVLSRLSSPFAENCHQEQLEPPILSAASVDSVVKGVWWGPWIEQACSVPLKRQRLFFLPQLLWMICAVV